MRSDFGVEWLLPAIDGLVFDIGKLRMMRFKMLVNAVCFAD
jgi:hypothetical protein